MRDKTYRTLLCKNHARRRQGERRRRALVMRRGEEDKIQHSYVKEIKIRGFKFSFGGRKSLEPLLTQTICV